MFVNRMATYEPLSEEGLATIDAGIERLASEIGVQFDHPRALELFRQAGQTVEGSCVRFDSDFLWAKAALAPSEFGMRARNGDRDLIVGGNHMLFAPAQGPPGCVNSDTDDCRGKHAGAPAGSSCSLPTNRRPPRHDRDGGIDPHRARIF